MNPPVRTESRDRTSLVVFHGHTQNGTSLRTQLDIKVELISMVHAIRWTLGPARFPVSTRRVRRDGARTISVANSAARVRRTRKTRREPRKRRTEDGRQGAEPDPGQEARPTF